MEESASSFTTVRIWIADFKRGRTSIENIERSVKQKHFECPSTETDGRIENPLG